MAHVWAQSGRNFFLSEDSSKVTTLKPAIYTLNQGMVLYLELSQEKFNFDYKVYGKDSTFIQRVLKTYDNTVGNLGMILNGIKGTGKTVTSKLLANALVEKGIPVILINHNFEDMQEFLNKIPQNVALIFDEFEKTFANVDANNNSKRNAGGDLLSMMDGVQSSNNRRIFILTSNSLWVDSNLLERPSRIRYVKHYEGLDLDTIIEIVDDILIHKELKDVCVQFISELEQITIDIVKAVLNEVNIHQESPYNFKSIFNVKLLDKKRNIYKVEIDESGKILSNKLVYSKVETNHRIFKDSEGVDLNVVGKILRCGKSYHDENDLGEIVEIIDANTVKVKEYNEEDDSYEGAEVIYSVQDTFNYNTTFNSYYKGQAADFIM